MEKKLLVYIEPLIEQGRPDLKTWWLNFAAHAINSIFGEKLDWENQCRIITSDYLKSVAIEQHPNMTSCAKQLLNDASAKYIKDISINECWDMMSLDSVATIKKWSDRTYDSVVLDKVADLIKSKLGSFEPNCILTFSPSPFLKHAFPKAVVMHQESGMLSAPPFPYTNYFDPIGMKETSSLLHFSSELEKLELNDEVVDGVARFRKAFIEDCLIPNSPFKQYKEGLQNSFDSLWIWPCQYSQGAGWGASLPKQDMWDMMTWVLDAVGPKTGIIFTENPTYNGYLTDERVAYWRKMFPNFIYHKSFYEIKAATHFLMDIVDGVFSLASGVGYHPLFWQKKLITLGETQFTNLADTSNIKDIPDILNQPWNRQKDAQLYWLLTQFNILQSHQQETPFLSNFFDRCMESKIKTGEVQFTAFQPAKAASTVMEDIISQGMYDVPIPA